MNSRQILLLIVAAVAALGVVLLVRSMFSGSGPKTVVPAAAPQTTSVEVLVAARTFLPGEMMSEADVKWQSWPKENIDPSLIVNDNQTPIANIVAASIARSPIVKGEPITLAKIIRKGTPGVMAAMLSAGMRAVAISVSTAAVAGGFVQPGNRVDILQTTSVNGKSMAEVVLSNIRVLAVNQTTDAVGQKGADDARTVTLELTLEQTKLITQKQMLGALSLALRPLVDTPGADGTSGPITIVRGGPSPQGDGG
jgi:pilus assembly protein CpaB